MSDGNPLEESAANRVTRLLAQAKGGNTIARDQLVDSVYHRLNGLCQALKSKYPGVIAYEQTGDVMGEVWPKLLRELSKKEFKDSAHFFSFSSKMIRNVLIDILRRYYGKNGRGVREVAVVARHESRASEGEPAVLHEGRDENSPDQDAMRAEMHHLINQLPTEHQQMFDLRFYHGLREVECAEALNVDVRTIRRRWRSARLALAAALGGQRG